MEAARSARLSCPRATSAWLPVSFARTRSVATTKRWPASIGIVHRSPGRSYPTSSNCGSGSAAPFSSTVTIPIPPEETAIQVGRSSMRVAMSPASLTSSTSPIPPPFLRIVASATLRAMPLVMSRHRSWTCRTSGPSGCAARSAEKASTIIHETSRASSTSECGSVTMKTGIWAMSPSPEATASPEVAVPQRTTCWAQTWVLSRALPVSMA